MVTQSISSVQATTYLKPLDFNVALDIARDQRQERDILTRSSNTKQAEGIELSSSPQLQKPKPQDGANAMKELVEAFCAIFTSMANGTKIEGQQMDALQTYDTTMSQSVMDNCNKTIQTQQKILDLEAQLSASEEKANEMNKSLGWLTYLGIGMSVLALLASIPTGGASLEVLFADAVDAASTDSAAGAAAEDGVELDNLAAPRLNNAAQPAAQPNAYQDLSFQRKCLYRWGQFQRWRTVGAGSRVVAYEKVFGIMGTVLSNVPMIVDGALQLHLAKARDGLADQQEQVAEPMAREQLNQTTFQFFSQLSQRQSDVCQNDGEQLGDVLQLSSSVMQGYNQIQVNLHSPA